MQITTSILSAIHLAWNRCSVSYWTRPAPCSRLSGRAPHTQNQRIYFHSNPKGATSLQTIIRTCAVIPTYNNPETIRRVVVKLREYVEDVIVVDDGSAEPGQLACKELQDEGLIDLVVRDCNGGKGAAVKDGLAHASACGFSHALQVDADGQHCLEDTPQFLEAASARPSALVLGCPVFDGSAPRVRLIARKLTTVLIHVETGGRVIRDAMCGFRIYPVAATQAIRGGAPAMDFYPDISVRQ